LDHERARVSPDAAELTEQRFAAEQFRLLGSALYVAGQGIAIMTPAVEAVGSRISVVNYGCSRSARR